MSKSRKKVAIAPVKNTQMQVAYHFPTAIYVIDMPDFLPAVNAVSEEYLSAARNEHELDEIYPVRMTNSFYNDERVKEFSEFIGQMAWNILNEQGYAMQNFNVTFMEMWTQEHFKHSAMDQHIHGFGSQITGFYFLETPDDCSRVVFHDPRAGKVQIDLPEQNMANATAASRMINFTPRPGMMIFANAWLAHAFTRHASDTPIKFVHFNLGVQQSMQSCPMPAAEVV